MLLDRPWVQPIVDEAQFSHGLLEENNVNLTVDITRIFITSYLMVDYVLA